MKMEWSAEAVRRLREKFGAEVRGFRLVYDTEGCGCAVNGVPALWSADRPEPGDVAAESDPFALWHDPRHAVFFDEVLRVSFLPERQSFRLSSDSQTYTTRLVLADRRRTGAAAENRN
ncbi:iron-sulfur cluster biosynthesis family protein [Cohnella sp. CFH 77786]|uniref:iron-sulfur cluster biosynthesis family protein n=1 Tax=Cohnella sp. CFH 77786 TaxID=2662265 RepID=UPI001C60C719|nr:iron-sulfur cluster biosynthesis family protein [Cohnella sp. CFH 77786]MBW5446537.1 iron-sulfur cluster biosynthesis family protein [Cohnella sp. CFH 77786]